MKRPEKKDCCLVSGNTGIENDIKILKDKAYNQACDDWEKYHEEELENLRIELNNLYKRSLEAT